MTASIVDNGDGTYTLGFAFTATQQVLLDTAGEAAALLYRRGFGVLLDGNGNPRDFSTLTSQEKADILDAYFKHIVLKYAGETYVSGASEAARITAEAELATRHSLG